MSNHSKRYALAAGSVGLVAGLGLGVTGLASATNPAEVTVSAAPDPGERKADPGERKARPHPRLQARMGQGPGGLVTKVSATSLTLSTPRGSKTVQLNGSTAFYEGKAKANASAIEVGEVVVVRLADPRATNPVASVVRVVPAHVAGWVKAIQGSTITLVDRAGFTRTVRTSGTTEFTKDGAGSSLTALAVGDFIHSVGSVAEDGTTLVATRVGNGKPVRDSQMKGEPDA
jgi:hypothetical protein